MEGDFLAASEGVVGVAMDPENTQNKDFLSVQTSDPQWNGFKTNVF